MCMYIYLLAVLQLGGEPASLHSHGPTLSLVYSKFILQTLHSPSSTYVPTTHIYTHTFTHTHTHTHTYT